VLTPDYNNYQLGILQLAGTRRMRTRRRPPVTQVHAKGRSRIRAPSVDVFYRLQLRSGSDRHDTRAMPARTFFRFLTLGLACGLPLSGQNQPSADSAGPITTDRPAVTAASVVVPMDSLQVENGFQETSNHGQNIVDAPESLLRFGVLKKTEFRFTVPDYFNNLTTGNGMGSGFGDLALGVKQQLGPLHGFDVSVIGYVSLPTGANGVSSCGYDPAAQVPWSRALTSNWTVAGMFSVYWPTQGHRRNVTGEATFLFDRQLTKPWDAFVEYAGDFLEAGGPRHLLHFGTALKIARRQQIDFHVGVGLSSAAVDYLIGIGYSFRVQAIRR
jgi:Putative MetA-pathway of phenol degradation